MPRHSQRNLAVGVPHADVTTVLPLNSQPARSRLDEALTGNDRQSGAHAGTGNSRRITPASKYRRLLPGG
jgi:hypothetical protein